MSFTLCTSAAIVTRAGAHVDSTASTSAAILEQFSNEAEGFIVTATRYDWVANYSSVGANFKPMLSTVASCLAAADLIAYKMDDYTTRGEAESTINVLNDRAVKALNILEKKENQGVMVA